MRLFTVILVVAISALGMLKPAEASDIRLHSPAEMMKLPNVRNIEHGAKRHVERELRLLQWQLSEPIRAVTRQPQRVIQSLPRVRDFSAPTQRPQMSADEKVKQWRAIECQRWGRCD